MFAFLNFPFPKTYGSPRLSPRMSASSRPSASGERFRFSFASSPAVEQPAVEQSAGLPLTPAADRAAPLGLVAMAEYETFMLGRDAEIAQHLFWPVRSVTHLRECHFRNWEWFEYRLHTDHADQIGRLSRQERRWLADAQREERTRRREERLRTIRAGHAAIESFALAAAARSAGLSREAEALEAQACVLPETDTATLKAAAANGSAPNPPAWLRWTVGHLDFWRRLSGLALVLAAGYYVPLWLAHHALLPFNPSAFDFSFR